MSFLRTVLATFLLSGLACCATAPAHPDSLDTAARDYVRLTLEIGERDEGYVDAYYGPPEWRAAAHAGPRTIAQLAIDAAAMKSRIEAIPAAPASPDRQRRQFLIAQLTAASTRLRMIQGERLSFAEEAQGLYGVTPILKPLSDYDPILARIERLVPGAGPLADRVESFTDGFIVPAPRVDAVVRAAIAECRRRTVAHIPLPAEEAFTLELVTRRSWSGYNWYQGNYRSLIQVNTDFPMRMGRVIDLGCHEGYPGHHVYNILLERALARGRGWVEYMVYPLYSPQSFIAEGSANYGIELAFPGDERLRFERRILYPLAGIPADGAEAYLQLQDAIRELGGARFTIARDFLEGRITREQAVELTRRYSLVSRARAEQSIAFTTQYRAYVINYGLGQDMVRAYVESAAPDPAGRWAAMTRILSEPILPSDLAAR